VARSRTDAVDRNNGFSSIDRNTQAIKARYIECRNPAAEVGCIRTVISAQRKPLDDSPAACRKRRQWLGGIYL
jgi:hypothetical protein